MERLKTKSHKINDKKTWKRSPCRAAHLKVTPQKEPKEATQQEFEAKTTPLCFSIHFSIPGTEIWSYEHERSYEDRKK